MLMRAAGNCQPTMAKHMHVMIAKLTCMHSLVILCTYIHSAVITNVLVRLHAPARNHTCLMYDHASTSSAHANLCHVTSFLTHRGNKDFLHISPCSLCCRRWSKQDEPFLLVSALQVWYGVLMSTAYSAHMFRSAVGVFAAMLYIYKTSEVSAMIPVPVRIRCAAAFCTSVGVVVGGGRLMPVTGKQGLQHIKIACQTDSEADAVEAFCQGKAKL